MSGGEGKKNKGEGSGQEWDLYVDGLLSDFIVYFNSMCQCQEDNKREDWFNVGKGLWLLCSVIMGI